MFVTTRRGSLRLVPLVADYVAPFSRFRMTALILSNRSNFWPVRLIEVPDRM